MGRVQILLEEITILNRKDELRKEDAYLWVYGLQILAPSGDPGLEFVRRRPSQPGNLGAAFKRGERRAVPTSVGLLEYDTLPVGRRALFGVLVFAWDHDRTDPARISSAYEGASRLIDTEIRRIVDANLAAGPDPKTGDFSGASEADERRIRQALDTHLRQTLLPEGVLSLAVLGVDDFIGGERVLMEVDDARSPLEQVFTMDLRKRDRLGAHYQVRGRLSWSPSSP